MKSCSNYSGISIIFFFIWVLIPPEILPAQEQNTIPSKQVDNGSPNLFHPNPTLAQFGTHRPTLNIVGKGLMYYENIALKHYETSNLPQRPGKGKSVIMKAAYSDLELEIMKKNMLFINKQYRIQIKEMIRKEKMDLNLGEAIKGFYTKPMF